MKDLGTNALTATPKSLHGSSQSAELRLRVAPIGRFDAAQAQTLLPPGAGAAHPEDAGSSAGLRALADAIRGHLAEIITALPNG